MRLPCGSYLGGVIACLLLLSFAPLRADEASVGILAGRWTYDSAKSRPVVSDLLITRTAKGTLHAEGGSSASYEFDLAGGSYPLSNGKTIAWVSTARDMWRASKKKNDEVLETVTVTLSGDTLFTATRGKLPDGSPYERNVTYRREGRGRGLIGRWHSLKVDTGMTRDGFVISTADDGVVTWQIPTDLQVITGRFDGSDLAIVGPNGPIGSTMAMRAAGPRRFAYVMKNGDQIAERGTVTISRDLGWLTELSWSFDKPDRKSRLVYKRDP